MILGRVRNSRERLADDILEKKTKPEKAPLGGIPDIGSPKVAGVPNREREKGKPQQQGWSRGIGG
jgi:hypothetical protein